MTFDVQLYSSAQSFDPHFGVVHTVSDGGFEKGFAEGYAQGETDGRQQGFADGKQQGYAEGHAQGYAEGETKGYADGLAARTYETWTLTLADGSTVEKEVALL